MKLEVGKKYRTRNKLIVFEVTAHAPGCRYPYLAKVVSSERGEWRVGAVDEFKADGAYFESCYEDECDLVELVEDKPASPPPLRLVVGAQYRTRNGAAVLDVFKHDPEFNNLFEYAAVVVSAKKAAWKVGTIKHFTANGGYRSGGEDEWDLVELVEDTAPAPASDIPSHYVMDDGSNFIDFIKENLTPEQFAGFCLGNAYKYAFRAGKKGSEAKEKDLAKLRQYIGWIPGDSLPKPLVELLLKHL